MRIALLIATAARPQIVATTLEAWRAQTRCCDQLVVSVVQGELLRPSFGPDVLVLEGEKGSCRQRNLGLDALASAADVVIVADDDYLPSARFVEHVEALFRRHPQIAVATGRVLADGVCGPGLTLEEAREILGRHERAPALETFCIAPTLGAYGCNMVINTRRTEPARFDERLPLYGWQEDIDFSQQCAMSGEIVWTDAFAGVHLGVKSGRTSGVKFGYSQVVNPVYLMAKGTMPPAYAARLVCRSLLANTLGIVRPEPFIDRLGRLRGNALAVLDLLRARLRPERVLEVG